LQPDKDTVGKFSETALSSEIADAAGRWKCTRVPRDFTGIAIGVRHASVWTSWFYSSNEAGPHRVPRNDLLAGTAEIFPERTAAIRGKVTGADGKPVVGAEVFARATARKPPHQLADRTKLAKPLAPPAPVKTDDAGLYSIPWRDDGSVVLMVFPTEGVPARTKVDAAPDMEKEDIELGKGRLIKGRLLGDDGKPISGAEVLLSSWGHTSLPRRKAVARTGEDGTYTWKSAPEEAMSLLIRADGYVSSFSEAPQADDDTPTVVNGTLRKLKK